MLRIVVPITDQTLTLHDYELAEPMRVRMAPSAQDLEACVDFGRKFAGIAGV